VRTTCTLALLLLAAPLSAQVDEAAVLAQFQADSKQVLAELKAATQAARADLFDAIAATEDGLAASGTAEVAGAGLAQALLAFELSLRTAQSDAAAQLDAAWLAALAGLAAGGPLGGAYPVGLASGDGGRLDDTRAAAAAQMAKLAKSVNKRLDKAEKLAAGLGVNLRAWLATPAALPASGADETLAFGSFPPLAIGAAVAASSAGAAADARLWVIGSTNSPLDVVHVEAVAGLAALDGGDATTSQTAWQIVLDGDGSGLAEGNVVLLAGLADGGAQVALAFSLP